MSAPFPANEPERLKALREYHILDTGPEPAFDDLTALASQVCQAPTALLTLVDEKRQWFKSHLGLDVSETHRDLSFCAHTILEKQFLEVPDATADERFRSNDLVTGPPHIRFYAGVPLVTPEGYALGSLTVIDYRPRQLSKEQREALMALGRQAVSQLELRRLVIRNQQRAEQAESKATQEEERFRAIIENSPDAFGLVSAEGVSLYASPGSNRILGFADEESIGRNVFEFAHLEEVAAIQGQFEKSLNRSRQPIQFECRVRHKQGHWVNCEVTLNNQLDHPLIRAVVANYRDITDRKRSEELVRYERDLSEQMVNSLPGIFYLFDREGRFLRWNRNFEAVTGYSSAEIRKLHPLDLFEGPDRNHIEVRIRHCFEYGESEAEAEMAAKDGGTIPYFFTGRLIQYEGRSCLIGMGVNVTERRRAKRALRSGEERLRLALKASNLGLWDWDVPGNQVVYSREWKRQLGYEDHEIANEYSEWEKRVHPDDIDRVKREVQAHLESSESYHETEFRMRHRDGSWRWIHARGEVFRNEENQPVRMLGCHVDFTDRVELEGQLRQAQKMEAIGQLAGGIAHDFNNVLGAILGNARLAWMDLPPEHPARNSIEEIRKAGERARDLVLQILAFCRQQTPNPKVLDVHALVEEAAGLLRATLPAGVALSTRFEVDSIRIPADPTQLMQVLLNLCTNSWQSMRDQTGSIDIQVSQSVVGEERACRVGHLSPGDHARIDIRDSGSGMDDSTLQFIFDPFFTTKLPGLGTGLGLSVVKGIVENHGGALEVESTPGKGTNITLYFPRAEASVESEPPEIEELPQGGGQHILFLDDEEPLVYLAERLFTRLGYAVSGFTRPEPALAAFEDRPDDFDAVVTDLNMPGASGLEFAQGVLAIRPGISVVLISGFITDELREKAHQLGVHRVLYKPNTVDELAVSLHNILSEEK